MSTLARCRVISTPTRCKGIDRFCLFHRFHALNCAWQNLVKVIDVELFLQKNATELHTKNSNEGHEFRASKTVPVDA